MIVTGWFGGTDKETPAGYGIRIERSDGERYFKKDWSSVVIRTDPRNEIEVNLTDSFWENCIELRSSKLGRWMFERKLAPWKARNPPKLRLEPIGERTFKLTRR